MFCAAFPLCAAAAFVTNVVEMRLDAHKFLTSQRPMPQPANGIGVWFPIMQVRHHAPSSAACTRADAFVCPVALRHVATRLAPVQLLSTLAVITNTVWIYLLTTVESGDGNFSSSLSNLVPSLGDVRCELLGPLGSVGAASVRGYTPHMVCAPTPSAATCTGGPRRIRVRPGAPAHHSQVDCAQRHSRRTG